jgi:hypothetical protein
LYRYNADVLRYVHREGLQVPSGKACAAAADGGHMAGAVHSLETKK